MSYDLIIRDGTIVDGSGMPRFRGDVGISGGKIAKIGKIRETAKETIDAEGQIVSPGLIDAHTHMDAQVFWDPLGTCSCWHGITSVVMGNCGFSLAPCAEKDKLMVMRNLERAEDISPEAMEAGIKWSWETYPQYLDAVDKRPRVSTTRPIMGIRRCAPMRWASGPSPTAPPKRSTAMKREVRDAIRAGAMGFTTSRTRNHQTPDGQPVASRLANWTKYGELVGVMGDVGAGVFEIAGEDTGADPERVNDYLNRLKSLAVDTGCPSRLACSVSRRAPDYWRPFFHDGRRNRTGGRQHVHSGS